MGRTASGAEAVKRAREAVKAAKTADELRVALAVILPIEFGFTFARTAEALGRGPSWIARHRASFIAHSDPLPMKFTHGGRRHGVLEPDEEVALVKNAVVLFYLGKRRSVRTQLVELLAELGKTPSPSTVTAIMERATARLAPGQKPSFLEHRAHALAKLWLPDLPLDLRRRHGLILGSRLRTSA